MLLGSDFIFIYHSEFGGFHSTDKNVQEPDKKQPKKFKGSDNLTFEMGFALSVMVIVVIVVNGILGYCMIHRIYKPDANR